MLINDNDSHHDKKLIIMIFFNNYDYNDNGDNWEEEESWS